MIKDLAGKHPHLKAFSPDFKYVFVVYYFYDYVELRVYEIETGDLYKSIKRPPKDFTSIFFHEETVKFYFTSCYADAFGTTVLPERNFIALYDFHNDSIISEAEIKSEYRYYPMDVLNINDIDTLYLFGERKQGQQKDLHRYGISIHDKNTLELIRPLSITLDRTCRYIGGFRRLRDYIYAISKKCGDFREKPRFKLELWDFKDEHFGFRRLNIFDISSKSFNMRIYNHEGNNNVLFFDNSQHFLVDPSILMDKGMRRRDAFLWHRKFPINGSVRVLENEKLMYRLEMIDWERELAGYDLESHEEKFRIKLKESTNYDFIQIYPQYYYGVVNRGPLSSHLYFYDLKDYL